MKKLFSQIVAAVLGLWLSVMFVPEVSIRLFSDSNFFGILVNQQWQIILILGIALGLINFFVRPVIGFIAFPLKILTLGLFSIVVNMAMIWLLDVIFREITVPLIFPLLWTTFIVWVLNFIIQKVLVKSED